MLGEMATPWKQPYPPPEADRQRLLLCLGAGVFVWLFLAVFKPFDIGDWQHPHKARVLAGYGLVTAGVLLANHALLPRLFKKFFREENFTVARNVAFNLW